jgi:hypothetical protein
VARLTAALEEQRPEDNRGASADEQLRERIAQLEAQLGAALDEGTRLQALVDAAACERQRRDAEYLAALTQLRLELDRAREEGGRRGDSDRQNEAVQREAAGLRQALANAQASLEQTIESQRQLAATLEESRNERERLAAALQEQEAERERRETEIREALIAQECLAELVDQRVSEREERVAHWQGEVALARADQKRVRSLFAHVEAEQQRLVAGRAADRAEAERALGEAIFRESEAVKALADQKIELQQWFDQAWALEPLAAAGRLALDVARELQTVLTRVDDRAQFLLGLSHLEASYRPEVEELRAEAHRAASLSRQLAPSMTGRAAQPPTEVDSADAGTETADSR